MHNKSESRGHKTSSNYRTSLPYIRRLRCWLFQTCYCTYGAKYCTPLNEWETYCMCDSWGRTWKWIREKGSLDVRTYIQQSFWRCRAPFFLGRRSPTFANVVSNFIVKALNDSICEKVLNEPFGFQV